MAAEMPAGTVAHGVAVVDAVVADVAMVEIVDQSVEVTGEIVHRSGRPAVR